MRKYILHQVNCLGAFGAGFARYLSTVSPDIRKDYQSYVMSHEDKRTLLGTYHIYDLDEHTSIVHIFSQYSYGRGACHTDYEAMDKAVGELRRNIGEAVCICPYLMGCGLAGGDWRIVEKILEKYSVMPSSNIVL